LDSIRALNQTTCFQSVPIQGEFPIKTGRFTPVPALFWTAVRVTDFLDLCINLAVPAGLGGAGTGSKNEGDAISGLPFKTNCTTGKVHLKLASAARSAAR
jgi:hypothetical protein